tara:strand:- start:2057 stop:2914 length:858 start_codon:yes stop_codon:yes gene_type:complete
MQKILIIGRGLISDYLETNNHKKAEYSFMSWRDISIKKLNNKLNLLKPDKLILLGFNKKFYISNIYLTIKLVIATKLNNFKGSIYYVNTHLLSSYNYRFVNVGNIVYTEYLQVKFFQSLILRKTIKNLQEIFLPPVSKRELNKGILSKVDLDEHSSNKKFFINVEDFEKIILDNQINENSFKKIFPFSGYIKNIHKKKSEIIPMKIKFNTYLKDISISIFKFIKIIIRDIIKWIIYKIRYKNVFLKSRFVEIKNDTEIINSNESILFLEESFGSKKILPISYCLK